MIVYVTGSADSTHNSFHEKFFLSESGFMLQNLLTQQNDDVIVKGFEKTMV